MAIAKLFALHSNTKIKLLFVRHGAFPLSGDVVVFNIADEAKHTQWTQTSLLSFW